MNIQSIRYISNSSTKSKMITSKLEKCGIESISDLEDYSNLRVVIVVGGDGEFLQALHKFLNQDILLYGINAGNFGFLMNEFDDNDLIKKIQDAQLVQFYPLQATIEDINGNIHSCFAFNEVAISRQTIQAARLEIKIDDIICMTKYLGDGMLVSTIIGSAAYNYANGGIVLPLSSNLLSMVPIAPFRPRRWRGALIPNNSVIQISVHDYIHRPCRLTADLKNINDIKSIKIKKNVNQALSVLFDQDNNLSTKLIQEQFQ